MGLPADPLLERGFKGGGLDGGWGLPQSNIHLQLRCTVVCFKTSSFQKSEKSRLGEGNRGTHNTLTLISNLLLTLGGSAIET